MLLVTIFQCIVIDWHHGLSRRLPTPHLSASWFAGRKKILLILFCCGSSVRRTAHEEDDRNCNIRGGQLRGRLVTYRLDRQAHVLKDILTDTRRPKYTGTGANTIKLEASRVRSRQNAKYGSSCTSSVLFPFASTRLLHFFK